VVSFHDCERVFSAQEKLVEDLKENVYLFKCMVTICLWLNLIKGKHIADTLVEENVNT
jgi:hypothetical protein